MAQTVKNLPVKGETLIWSLGWEYPLEKGMATHSSIRAWEIPWRRAWWATVHEVAKRWQPLKQLTLSLNKRKVIKYIMRPAENTAIEKDETYANMAKS